MIGLGGGSLADAFQRMFPTANIEIVEINPVIFEVAQKYFFFKPRKNTNVIIEDGYLFLQDAISKNKKYDFIIVDAFSKDSIVPVFITEEFAKMVKSGLSEGGVVVVNTIANSPDAHKVNKIYTEVFGKFINLKFENNRELVAIKGELPTMQRVAQNASALEEKLEMQGVMKAWLMSIFKQYNKLP